MHQGLRRDKFRQGPGYQAAVTSSTASPTSSSILAIGLAMQYIVVSKILTTGINLSPQCVLARLKGRETLQDYQPEGPAMQTRSTAQGR